MLAAVDRNAGAAERLARAGATLDRLFDDAELLAAAIRGPAAADAGKDIAASGEEIVA
ncbi:hypothetical protein GCM10023178_41700 [Actinomadura luteofluorescens]